MKKLNILLLLFALIATAFTLTSCGDDDETFYTGDGAQSAVEHKWNVSSISIESNYTDLDGTPNYLFQTILLNIHTYTKTFDGENIITYIEPKDTVAFSKILLQDKYVFLNENMLITNSLLASTNFTTLPYTYSVSDKTLKLTTPALTKPILLMIFQLLGSNAQDSVITPLLYSTIEALPDDYSGKITLTMNR